MIKLDKDPKKEIRYRMIALEKILQTTYLQVSYKYA